MYRFPLGITMLLCLSAQSMKIRVLVNMGLHPNTLSMMYSKGLLYKYINDTTCNRLSAWKKFFETCQVERFHINPGQATTTILFVSQISVIGLSKLRNIETLEEKLFHLNDDVRTAFHGSHTVVDIYQEELISAIGRILVREDKTMELRRKFDMFIPVPVSVNELERFFPNWAEEYQEVLKAQLHSEVKDITFILVGPLCGSDSRLMHVRIKITSLLQAKDINFPERWYIALKGMVSMIRVLGTHSRNFRLPVYSDKPVSEIWKLNFDMLLPSTVAEASCLQEEGTVCDELKVLLFHALAARFGSGFIKYSCFPLERSPDSDLDEIYVRLRIHLQRNLGETNTLGDQEYSDMNLVEVFSSAEELGPFCLFRSLDVPTYEMLGDSEQQNWFTLIIETFDLYFDTSKEAKHKLTLEDSIISCGLQVFCSQLQQVLLLSSQNIQCTGVRFSTQLSRTVIHINVQINKATSYWTKASPLWTIPLKVAKALKERGQGIIFNVRWKRHAKYADGVW